MAPDLEVTEQSDLYALGCVLYEMLAGTPPFVSDSQQQVLMRHIREEPDLKKLPADARPMAAWLLAKDPARRAPDANAVVTALSGTTLSSQGGRSRWRVAAFIALPVLVGVAGLGIAAGLMGGSERDDVAAAGPSATSAATAAVNGGGSSTAVNSAQTGPKGAESQTSSPAQLTRPPDERGGDCTENGPSWLPWPSHVTSGSDDGAKSSDQYAGCSDGDSCTTGAHPTTAYSNVYVATPASGSTRFVSAPR